MTTRSAARLPVPCGLGVREDEVPHLEPSWTPERSWAVAHGAYDAAVATATPQPTEVDPSP